MPSKRRPVGDSLVGATVNFVWRRSAGRDARVFYTAKTLRLSCEPQERARRARPLQAQETPRAQPPRECGSGQVGVAVLQNQLRPPRKAAATTPSSATDQIAEEFFDAGLFAGVILLGNGAGLLAQLEAKHFLFQGIEVRVNGFLDGLDAGLLPCGFASFFRFRGSSVLAVRGGHQDNLFARQQN